MRLDDLIGFGGGGGGTTKGGGRGPRSTMEVKTAGGGTMRVPIVGVKPGKRRNSGATAKKAAPKANKRKKAAKARTKR